LSADEIPSQDKVICRHKRLGPFDLTTCFHRSAKGNEKKGTMARVSKAGLKGKENWCQRKSRSGVLGISVLKKIELPNEWRECEVCRR